MSKLESLITELCPNGVHYQTIGEVCQTITDYTAAGSFADIAKNVKYQKQKDYAQLIRTTDLKSDFSNPDSFIYVNEHAFKYLWRVNLNSEGLVLPNVGNCGEVYYIVPTIFPDENNVLGPNAIWVKSETALNRYLFHVFKTAEFQTKIRKIISPTGQTKFNKTSFKKLTIPIPPLVVQAEIVRILDNFTELTAELTAELTTEKVAVEKQYRYYLDKLIDDLCGKEIYEKPLKDIATITRGGSFQKKHFLEDGIPCIHYGQIYTKYGLSTEKTINYINEDVAKKQKFAKPNDVVMAVTSENVDDVCKCVAWLGNQDVAISGHSAIIHHNQNPKYLSYYFSSSHFFAQKRKIAHGTKVIEVSPNALNEILIPVPPLQIQNEIVRLMDAFSVLIEEYTSGLTKEIMKRQTQYTFYRDRLLTFPELKQ